jgi:hypothetical protein
MADEGQRIQLRLQEGVNNMITAISASRLKPMQKKMYLTMADCCDLKNDEATNQCLERASQPMNFAQQIIQNEMAQLQSRVQRCGQECEDNIRDSMSNQDMSKPKVQDEFMRKANVCMNTCADKHLALLTSVKARIEKDIDSKAG